MQHFNYKIALEISNFFFYILTGLIIKTHSEKIFFQSLNYNDWSALTSYQNLSFFMSYRSGFSVFRKSNQFLGFAQC